MENLAIVESKEKQNESIDLSDGNGKKIEVNQVEGEIVEGEINETAVSTLTFSEIAHLKSLETISDKCKVCQIPEDLRLRLYKDHLLGAGTLEVLADELTIKLKERNINTIINPVNLYQHFKNHFQVDGVRRGIAVNHLKSVMRQDLAIVDSEQNGKSIFDLVEEGAIENIKPITKAVLLSKTKRLEKLLTEMDRISKEESEMGEPLKLHREVSVIENDIFKTAAVAVRDFFLDPGANYDKALFIVHDLAAKIFMIFQQKDIDYNGQVEKKEALKEIQEGIASLFDQYEKEVDTVNYKSV